MTEELVDIEMAAHGGTIVEIQKGDEWQVGTRQPLQSPHHARAPR